MSEGCRGRRQGAGGAVNRQGAEGGGMWLVYDGESWEMMGNDGYFLTGALF